MTHRFESAPGWKTRQESIGPYRILDVLGEGGMGVVYLAEQQEPIRRRVALKVIKRGMDTQEVVARFLSERQALAMLDHPAIAKVFDAGATEDGRPYFAMEYVKGVSITEYCDRHKLTIRERLDLFLQVCRGVEHAHHQGIIHRDLKPSNIIVSAADEKPVAKVIDFGVAKATNQRLVEKTIYTELGRVVGTPAYMSPEQAEMTAETVDHRTDVYSLGVLLYELLVGELPIDPELLKNAAFDELLRRIREDEPPLPSIRWSRLNLERTTKLASSRRASPQTFSRQLRGDLDWITMKALEKERLRRYGSALELARDVERHLKNEPVAAGPPGILYRARKYVRKNRGFVTAAAIVMVVLSAGLAGSLSMYLRSEAAYGVLSRTLTENERLLGEVQREVTLKGEALERNESLVRELEAETKAKTGALQETSKALDRAEGLRLATQSSVMVVENPGLALLLGLEAAALVPGAVANDALLAALKAVRERRTFVANAGAVGWAAFSPDGDLVATASADSTARLWDAATGKEVRRLEGHKHWLNYIAFSADGRRLVTASGDGTARLWDAATGRELLTLNGKSGEIRSAAFSPDGARVVTASPRQTAVWDVSTGKLIAGINEHDLPEGIVFAAFSPDGRQVVTASDTHWSAQVAITDDDGKVTEWSSPTLLVWDASTGVKIEEIEGCTADLRTAVFSPDGGLLLTAGDDGARIWDRDTRKEIMALTGHSGPVSSAAFSPDGRRVVTAGHDRAVLVWEASSGNEILRLMGHTDVVRAAGFSPDGMRLVTASDDSTARVWEPGEVKEFLTLAGHADMVHSANFSPDGLNVLTGSFMEEYAIQHIMFERGDRTLRIWSAITGKEIHRFDIDGQSRVATFSEGGRKVIYVNGGGTVSSWEASSGTALPMRAGFTGHGEPLASSPDGDLLLLAPGGRGTSVRVLKVPTGESVCTLSWDRGLTECASISGDLKWAITADEGSAWVWDLAARREVVRLRPDRIKSVAISPTGDRAVTALWDGRVQVWETSTGKLLTTLVGHAKEVNSVAFSPDGLRIVTASADHTACIWDVATGRLFLTLRGHTDAVNSAAFSPDGARVVTASADRTVRIWPADPVAAAHRWKPRELTPAERQAYEINARREPRGF